MRTAHSQPTERPSHSMDTYFKEMFKWSINIWEMLCLVRSQERISKGLNPKKLVLTPLDVLVIAASSWTVQSPSSGYRLPCPHNVQLLSIVLEGHVWEIYEGAKLSYKNKKKNP